MTPIKPLTPLSPQDRKPADLPQVSHLANVNPSPAQLRPRKATPMPRGLVARARFDSPLGPLAAAVTTRGLALLWFDAPADPAFEAIPEQPDHEVLAQTAAALAAYWRDPAVGFSIALDLQGTPFQQRVWRALLDIAPGSTDSYGALARRIGATSAVRAVGAAAGANPVGIIVPCHRLVGSRGELTGYAAGLTRKAALLRHEAQAASAHRLL